MRSRFAYFAVLVCLISPFAVAQKVYVDYNHAIDFSAFRTYAWGQGANPNAIQDSILLQTVQNDVNSQLQAKGLQLVQESQNPDIIVVINSGVKQQTSYNAWGTGGWAFGGGMGEITPEVSNVGTLVVDVYDANRKQLVWRGISQDTLSSKASKDQKMVDKAVEKMFKKYP